MDLYCKATRMEVNIHKSSILFNGLGEELERQCVDILSFTLMPFQNGLKYLVIEPDI
jgi:hypothetical protein